MGCSSVPCQGECYGSEEGEESGAGPQGVVNHPLGCLRGTLALRPNFVGVGGTTALLCRKLPIRPGIAGVANVDFERLLF